MNIKYTILLLTCLGITFQSKSQVINKGEFKISAGTTVILQEDYTNDVGGNHFNNGDFYLNGDFINNGDTNAESGSTVFTTSTKDVLNLTGTSKKVEFFDLEVNVAAGKKGVLVANEYVVNVENKLNLTSGDLRLVGSTELIQNSVGESDNLESGTGNLIQDQQGTSSPFAYDYWSAPVHVGSGFKIGSMMLDGSDAQQNPFIHKTMQFIDGSPYNGKPSEVDGAGNVTKGLSINKRWLHKYTRGSGLYNQWIRINQNDVLEPGLGFTMKGTGTAALKQNYVFKGKPNNGSYTFSITNGEFILLGNPYPSALDVKKFLGDNITVITALKFWVDGGSTSHYLSDYLGGYSVYNNTGGTLPSVKADMIAGLGSAGTVTIPKYYIPVGGGFFVEAENSGTIKFRNSHRQVENRTSIAEQKKGTLSTQENQYIRLGFEDSEGFHRQLLLGFLPNSLADLSFNRGYDYHETDLRKEDMYFLIPEEDHKSFIIQGVNAFFDMMEFPIGINIAAPGNHRVMLDAAENFDGAILLKDNLLNIAHNLRESHFKVDLPLGNHTDRYSLVFKPVETLHANTAEFDKSLIYYDGRNQIVIIPQGNNPLKSIDVYNVMGQHVLHQSSHLEGQSKIVLPFSESVGVYMVVLKTSTAQKSTKILKY